MFTFTCESVAQLFPPERDPLSDSALSIRAKQAISALLANYLKSDVSNSDVIRIYGVLLLTSREYSGSSQVFARATGVVRESFRWSRVAADGGLFSIFSPHGRRTDRSFNPT